MADGNTCRDGYYLCIIVIKVARIDQDQINGEANVPFVMLLIESSQLGRAFPSFLTCESSPLTIDCQRLGKSQKKKH